MLLVIMNLHVLGQAVRGLQTRPPTWLMATYLWPCMADSVQPLNHRRCNRPYVSHMAWSCAACVLSALVSYSCRLAGSFSVGGRFKHLLSSHLSKPKANVL